MEIANASDSFAALPVGRVLRKRCSALLFESVDFRYFEFRLTWARFFVDRGGGVGLNPILPSSVNGNVFPKWLNFG